MHLSLPLILVLTTLFAHQTTASYLVTSPNAPLSKRDDSAVQGWALVEDECPSGTGTCGARSCCPLDSWCDTSETEYSNICCPTREGCGYNVTHLSSRCAVDTWVLFTTNKDPICCLPGEVGTDAAASENYGHCVPAGVALPASVGSATLIGSGGTTIPPALPVGLSTTAGATTSSMRAESSLTSTNGVESSASRTGSGVSTGSVQATSASTGATATVTVKSGAEKLVFAPLLLGTFFGVLMVF
ncbi:uncharacterized protein LY89DRAFT_743352 [Mollisia scopiformis]|uniref:Uncharacterized protein n=1 Tax=Mollisia scopiformis TaxID=149040 RepID=A0A132B3P2_MOLSC|nr:uncharacterized protein LY89DRAFT_743352 [Mollisia scopiformis]KUJ07025.1 hypothetical protein LY89DRAFT_743352 [Mollisia scopiformis]